MSASAEAAAPLGSRAGTAGALRRDARRERRVLVGLSMPAVALVLVFMVLPVGWLFWLSLFDDSGAVSLVNYVRIFTKQTYLNSFSVTFTVSLSVTGLCIGLGYPVAYLLSELPRRAAGLLMAAVMLPYWTSVLVRTYAWLILLQRSGLINEWAQHLGLISEPLPLANNLTGTVIGMTHIMLPFFILPLYSAMRSIDRIYMTAAASLGASPTRAFWTIFVPLSVQGLAAGSFLVFVLCMGFYVTPAVLGGGRVIMMAQQIERSITLYSNWGAASALGVALLAMTVLVLAIGALIGKLLFRPHGGDR